MAKVFSPMRHTFLYRWEDSNGKQHEIKAKAKVRNARHSVVLTVKPAHVEKSIRRHGVGDTANCAMAVCASDHADAFPHKVEGHIDWTYTRAFVVSKSDKNGLPIECYGYEHSDDIARLNDSPSGQQKLLRKLQDEGPLQITLTPQRVRSKKGRHGAGRKVTGKRDVVARLRGGKLRYAVANVASEK